MIIVNLDVMMAKRKISLGELSERVGITPANLSILKTGKARQKPSAFQHLIKYVRFLTASLRIFWNTNTPRVKWRTKIWITT